MSDTFQENFIQHNTNEKYPTELVDFQRKSKNVYVFKSENNVLLKIEFVSDDIVRVRYSTRGYFLKDFSYAIDPDHTFDQVNVKEDTSSQEEIILRSATTVVHIGKQNMKVSFKNLEGKEINGDEKGFHWELDQESGNDIVLMSKQVKANEYYFGLGDKSCEMNLRGKRFSVWGTDTYGYGKHSDPLYKNIPFYIGVHNKLAYGVFFDNSHRTFFDFGHERSEVTSFWGQGGEMNYYFINGPEAIDVVSRYTNLTGKPELPPLWALGYHQCKWSYYPESNVREICEEFRERKIPCDAIYLDIDYMDEYRCFTWDNNKFPSPTKMISELAEDGYKTVVIIDPGIKVDEDYWVWKEGFEKELFCKRIDGPLMEAPVWPGACHFPDFTNPKAREWWRDLFKGLISENGIKGIWNDMNEPAVFKEDNFTQGDRTFPNNVLHDYDGHQCGHSKGHNVYGMQMARATYDGVKKFAYPDRPFVITRSGYTGVQRYSSGWTGDNVATWEHLWIANMQCQRLSISGMSFVGSDIGGFIQTPDPELYIRWLQLGIFHIFCRTHSSGDHGDQEPWSYGEPYTSLARRFINLRYQLLPTIYTLFWEHIKTGKPMLRPITLLDQTDAETLHRMEEFGLGNDLIVCPITQQGAKGRWLYLPKGDWYYYWTDEVSECCTEIWAEANLERIPLYVRAGSVLVKHPVIQYVGERTIDVVDLNIYHIDGVKSDNELYQDAGDGYENENGQYSLRTFEVEGSSGKLCVKQEVSGDFVPDNNVYNVILHAIPFDIEEIKVDGEPVGFESKPRKGRGLVVFSVSNNFNTIEII